MRTSILTVRGESHSSPVFSLFDSHERHGDMCNPEPTSYSHNQVKRHGPTLPLREVKRPRRLRSLRQVMVCTHCAEFPWLRSVPISKHSDRQEWSNMGKNRRGVRFPSYAFSSRPLLNNVGWSCFFSEMALPINILCIGFPDPVKG